MHTTNLGVLNLVLPTCKLLRSTYQFNCMDESREIAGLGPSLGRARAYGWYYLWWDGLKVVADQILTNVLLAWLGVFVICVILLGSVPAALYVLLSLICINTEVLGSYWWMGESINYVSGIFLVRRVGDCFSSQFKPRSPVVWKF